MVIFYEKVGVSLRRAWLKLSDQVPISIVEVIKGINSILQKKKRIYYVRKKHLEKNNTYKNTIKIRKLKFKNLPIEILIFLFQILLIPFVTYAMNYDNWDLISKFWSGPTKWNIPFI